MGAGTRDWILFAVTLVAAVGCARFYVLAVLDTDRPLSRAAAAGFLVFGAAAVIFFLRSLL